MAAIVTNKFRINNAEQFVESFSETAATTYYLFIGRLLVHLNSKYRFYYNLNLNT